MFTVLSTFIQNEMIDKINGNISFYFPGFRLITIIRFLLNFRIGLNIFQMRCLANCNRLECKLEIAEENERL